MLNIYPPILQSTQVAFLTAETNYPIYFKLSSVTNFDNVGHIQIRIVRQANNRTIVNTDRYPDGIIYKSTNSSDVSFDVLTQTYAINISAGYDLQEVWQPGYLYKVQLRFGTSDLPWLNNLSQFASWKRNEILYERFSEWSTVMLIKSVNAPNIYIENMEKKDSDTTAELRTEPGLNPTFIGYCIFDNQSNEIVESYKFDLYSEDDIEDPTTFLETSGWLPHVATDQNTGDSYRFKRMLVDGDRYTVIYSIRTVNGFEISRQVNRNKLPVYTFTTIETYLTYLDITITAVDDSQYCIKNGVIQLYLQGNEKYTGNFVISRASETTNFEIYEDIKFLQLSRQELNNYLAFEDYTVESGARYRYALQQENALGIRTDPVYSAESRSHAVNFDYSYLYRDGVQLKMKFNQRISSFKHTTLRSKQDTLGDKYPHLSQNGNAYYSEFPISGLISFQMDDDYTFFKLLPGGFFYKDELILPRDRFKEEATGRTASGGTTGSNYDSLTINCDLTHENIFIERKFREKVEEFLNSMDYKLFRSPTEGNIMVGLLNVSLTPKQELGRMIYEFSATAYEVADNDLKTLDEFGIIDIGQFESIATEDITISFGQAVWDATRKSYPLKFKRGNTAFYNSSVGSSDLDIYKLIKQQEEISIGGGYMYRLKRVVSLWIEPFPQLDMTVEKIELKKERADLLNEGVPKTDKRIIAIENELANYDAIDTSLSGPQGTAKFKINGTEIIILPNKIYQLSEEVNSIELIVSTTPFIINYVCHLTEVEDRKIGIVSAIDGIKVWGQIAGIFTDTNKVLKSFDYYYKTSPYYRIFNPRPDVTYNERDYMDKRTLVDNTTINVFRTVNIYEIIKQEVQYQVELKRTTTFEEDENGELTDGNLYYTFVDMVQVDIETEPGAIISIGKSADGSDAVPVRVGPTGRYTLYPSEKLIQYISFTYKNNKGEFVSKPQYALINYRCKTNVLEMVYLDGEE